MTIILDGVYKEYRTRSGLNPILKDVNLRVEPGEHVGILGQNGSGKSTLIRVLSGSEPPNRGTVQRNMSVSWPLAFGGAFLGALTGLDNVRFVCRLYGVDPEDKLPFVEEFTELGRYLREPVRSYSSGMRARLAFATSMAIDFDCYLIDEIVAVGDDRFQRKCEEELFDKRRNRALLIVSHSDTYIAQHCDRASVLVAGKLTNFPNVEDAFSFYSTHELAMQPHMAIPPKQKRDSDDEAGVGVDLGSKFEADLNGRYAEAGAQGVSDRVREVRLERAPIFDALDLAGRLNRAGQLPVALSVLDFLASEHPREPLISVTKGDFLAAMRQHRPAVAAYLAAIEIDPTNYWAQRNLAEEYYNTGHYAEAAAHYSAGVKVAPDRGSALALEMRALDCACWIDAPVPPLDANVPGDGPAVVVEQSFAALEDGSAARMALGGLLNPGLVADALTCVAIVGDRSETLTSCLPSASLRRYAAAKGLQAFAFRTYCPLSSDGHEAQLALALAGLPVAQETAVRTVLPGTATGDDALASARNADAHHQAGAAALWYGLHAQEHSSPDIERFAENLIALGLYHEAEERLLAWRDAHGPAQALAEDSPVLDLLCVEICRSRVPGWQAEIDRCLTWAESRGSSTSYLANLGHRMVEAHDIAGAADRYDQASQLLGADTLIHFARGIHTARFVNEVPAPAVKQGDERAPAKHDMVHLFACDGRYFERFADALVRSSLAAKGEVNLRIHAHIVDPAPTTLILAERLAAEVGLAFTTEQSPGNIADENVRRAYFTCARFLIAPTLLQTYGCPITITETDALINWSWQDIRDHLREAGGDVGYVHSALWNWVPWTKIPAGIFQVAPTPIGHAWADYIARYIRHAFARQASGNTDVWTVDQVALWLSHALRPEGSRAVHLPMSSLLTLATGDKTNVLAPA